ncbi:MAG: protein kinase [Gammaproteobacteria bacterium]|nr:protein kinase [Gammaproteobacteria bacterium]
MGQADLICLEETRKKEMLFHMRIMKKVPGIPQHFFCLKPHVTKAERIQIAVSDVDELKKMHDRMMIHGDVKGANYLWDNDLKKATLIDFDFSKDWPIKPDTPVRIDGTHRYMAPEIQLIGVSKPGDIYALGKTLIEVLCPSGSEWTEINQETKAPRIAVTREMIEEDLKKIGFNQLEAPPLAGLLLRMIDPLHYNRPLINEVKDFIGRITAESGPIPPPARQPTSFLTWMSAASSGKNAACVAEAK